MNKPKRFLSILLLIVLVLSVCTVPSYAKDSKDPDAQDILHVLFHEPYLTAAKIKTNCSSKREKIIGKIESTLLKEPYVLKKEDGGWFGKDYYAVTSGSYGTLYYGKVKNNRPDGFGVLANGIVDLNNLSSLQNLIYAGNFKKGLYNGYGATFNTPDKMADYDRIAGLLAQNGQIPYEKQEIASAYAASYVTYDGEWKNGAASGKGNSFYMDLSEWASKMDSSEYAQENYWGGICYPNHILISGMKKDEASGSARQYYFGHLMYDGKMKYRHANGTGTSYYFNGQKKYVGRWKDDSYHGKGTLYDDAGNVIYKGKWEHGDYKS